MAAPVMVNEFVGFVAKRIPKPRPFKIETGGHPEKQNQSLGVDVPKWHYPAARIRQVKNAKGCATRQTILEAGTLAAETQNRTRNSDAYLITNC
jgi:hypothetical protein